MNEYGFFFKEVALKLDINASTLRQWCLAMEKEGYEFNRNKKARNRDDAIKRVVSRQRSVDNVEKLLSVNENKLDNITVSKGDLEELIQGAVEKVIEKERDYVRSI
jgi:transposase-like protein